MQSIRSSRTLFVFLALITLLAFHNGESAWAGKGPHPDDSEVLDPQPDNDKDGKPTAGKKKRKRYYGQENFTDFHVYVWQAEENIHIKGWDIKLCLTYPDGTMEEISAGPQNVTATDNTVGDGKAHGLKVDFRGLNAPRLTRVQVKANLWMTEWNYVHIGKFKYTYDQAEDPQDPQDQGGNGQGHGVQGDDGNGEDDGNSDGEDDTDGNRVELFNWNLEQPVTYKNPLIFAELYARSRIMNAPPIVSWFERPVISVGDGDQGLLGTDIEADSPDAESHLYQFGRRKIRDMLIGTTAAEQVDAISSGHDFLTGFVFFSVDNDSEGEPATGVNDQFTIDEEDASTFVASAGSAGNQLHLKPVQLKLESDDTVDGLEVDYTDAQFKRYGFLQMRAYYSVEFPPAGESAATIYVGERRSRTIFATPADLGLSDDDDIDALAVFDANGDGVADAGTDIVFFSLARGSSYLVNNGHSAADIFRSSLDGLAPTIEYSAADLGLLDDDNVDALDLLTSLAGPEFECIPIDAAISTDVPSSVQIPLDVTNGYTVRGVLDLEIDNEDGEGEVEEPGQALEHTPDAALAIEIGSPDLTGGASTVLDINEFGEITGESQEGTTQVPFLHMPGFDHDLLVGMNPLALPDQMGVGGAINDFGMVAGMLVPDPLLPPQAMLWLPPQLPLPMPLEPGLHTLGTLGGEASFATDLNNYGQVVGFSQTDLFEDHAFLWEDGEMIDLGTLDNGFFSQAFGINNVGEVVGVSSDQFGFLRPVLWTEGDMIDLGTLGGLNAMATAINDLGEIVGWSETDSGDNRAFLYLPQPNYGLLEGMHDLGALEFQSQALDINNRGQIVGGSDGRAVLWNNGQIYPLDEVMGENGAWEMQIATAINESGQIVGNGFHNADSPRGFALSIATAIDCNENGIPDFAEILDGLASDCNGNNIPDDCDFESGVLTDENLDGIPDQCVPPVSIEISAGEWLFEPGDLGTIELPLISNTPISSLGMTVDFGTVDIEIVELSLVGVEPIQVEFQSSNIEETFFDVSVVLSNDLTLDPLQFLAIEADVQISPEITPGSNIWLRGDFEGLGADPVPTEIGLPDGTVVTPFFVNGHINIAGDPPVENFLRGDANGDGVVIGIVDAIGILSHGFFGDPVPCLEALDVNNDGVFFVLTDAIYLLNHSFGDSPPPSAPYPECGTDPDAASSLGCESPTDCP